MKHSNAVVALLMLFGMSGIAHAVAPWEPTPAEMRLLPPYCVAKFDGTKEQRRAWAQRLGRGFQDIHHFCAGMNFLRRANRAPTNEVRRFNLKRTVTNMNYMIDHSPPDFVLMPAVYLYKGRALEGLGRMGAAAAAFGKAIALRPDYVPPYVELSAIFHKTGDEKKAEQVLRDGLKHKPGSRILRRRLSELTRGKKS